MHEPPERLHLWGRQLYVRQPDPLAWAEAVLAAAGPHAEESGLAWYVHKLRRNLTAGARYDHDTGWWIAPLAHRLATDVPGLTDALADTLGGRPLGPASLIALWAEELTAPAAPPRHRAVDALIAWAELGDRQARAALHAAVADHRTADPTVWTKALNRVGLFGDATLAGPLLGALADHPGFRGAPWAATACAELGLRQAVPLVLPLLADRDRLTRHTACQALGRLGDPATVPALVGLLDDPAELVRAGAAAALAAIGGTAARAALRRELTLLRHPRAGYLASAVGSFGPDALDDLIALAADPSPERRYWACRALGVTAEDRALPVLEHLAATDLARTDCGGRVATAARHGLRTAHRIRARRSPPGAGRP
ncbi:HEAT repeat domain-containing protein [Kitasatospora sp. NPDC088346]|uniref:HEAT repeat domain-containing protein n=1 Tax=Kitasatospora sp. NPDC088346 TaxID=3364073 RepID=UPI0037F72D6D